MNWDEMKGNWKQASGKIRETWGDLTDDDLQRARGSQDQLVGVIQQRYGIAREEAKKQVDDFFNASNGMVAQVKTAVTDRAHEVEDYFKNTDYSDMVGDLRKVISKHPLPSLFVGIGVGYLLGRAISVIR